MQSVYRVNASELDDRFLENLKARTLKTGYKTKIDV
jgi:hypothetical protein